MSKKTQNNSSKKNGNVLGRWFSRWFRGGSNQLAEELEKSTAGMDKEELVSPGKQVLRNFLERKLAVGALCLLIVMFLTMIIGPMFMPTYSDSYTEITQKNVPPTMSMMKVPKELAGDIKMIDGFGSFTVGLSNAGKVYIWGPTQIGTTGIDVADIPQEVQDSKITMIAAGIDHIVAISEEGKIFCWGNNRLGQYGTAEETLAAGGQLNPNIAYMPEELAAEGVDPSHIKKFTCGYQCTAILMDDGTLYLWGNKLTYGNMDVFLSAAGLKDIDFTLNYIVGLNMKRDSVYTGTRGLYDVARGNVSGPTQKTKDFLNGRTITSLTATSSSVCLLLSDGSLGFVGDFATDTIPAPTLAEGEKFVQVVGGSYHYTGLTDQGRVYSWGSNTQGQTDVPSEAAGASRLFSGSFQSYGVDENNSLQAKWGLKGYLFGTEVHGADIFQRIINGGKMTMTIGAVAVIISAIIGMVVGCLSGYFGGKVDILLMRVAEIFTAIPFLPFAMILSSVMGRMNLSENMRIFIIMCILGVLTWPGLAKLVRGQVLVARESEYVMAAKSMGVKEWRIAFKHILPNVMSVILVSLMLDFGTCMLTESTLSYLGFGVAYPRPTWGNMLNGANNATIINAYWWQWLFTAAFLAVTTICINIVGDALRDVMDPRSSVDK